MTRPLPEGLVLYWPLDIRCEISEGDKQTFLTMTMTMTTMMMKTLLSRFPSSPDPDSLTDLDHDSSQGQPVSV